MLGGGDTRQYAELSIAFGGGSFRDSSIQMARGITFLRERSDGGPPASGGLAGGGWEAGGGGVSSGFSARFY